MAVHAYLHRKEGSTSNADHWYHRAGRNFQRPTLDAEWSALVEGLLYGTENVRAAVEAGLEFRVAVEFVAAAFRRAPSTGHLTLLAKRRTSVRHPCCATNRCRVASRHTNLPRLVLAAARDSTNPQMGSSGTTSLRVYPVPRFSPQHVEFPLIIH
jgi:hypothetical protein